MNTIKTTHQRVALHLPKSSSDADFARSWAEFTSVYGEKVTIIDQGDSWDLWGEPAQDPEVGHLVVEADAKDRISIYSALKQFSDEVHMTHADDWAKEW